MIMHDCRSTQVDFYTGDLVVNDNFNSCMKWSFSCISFPSKMRNIAFQLPTVVFTETVMRVQGREVRKEVMNEVRKEVRKKVRKETEWRVRVAKGTGANKNGPKGDGSIPK